MRVHLQTLGCRLNEAELETWSRQFRAQGHDITADVAAADLVVVNTCAVTQEAARKSRNLVRRAQGDNPSARLVMSGCYASLAPEQAAADLGVDLVVPNADKDALVDIVQQGLGPELMPAAAIDVEAGSLLRQGRQRAFVKVQDGCRYRCTYCVVTLARGAERSRPVAQIVDEIRRLHTEGIQEVVLTGVHLGGYGAGTDADLRALVEAILGDTAMPRIRLGSLEPWDLPADFWTLFDNPRLMPHLHLPLQSGSDSVLRRMARRCRTAEFRELVRAGRARVADLNITTDIIVGFPGETEAEWRQTLDFAADMAFGHIHIFSYSARSGTKAAGLPGQLPRQVKKARSQELHALAATARQAFMQRQVGRRRTVLVEGGARHGERESVWSGYTPNYVRVTLPAVPDAALDNQCLVVELTQISADGASLRGRLVPTG